MIALFLPLDVEMSLSPPPLPAAAPASASLADGDCLLQTPLFRGTFCLKHAARSKQNGQQVGKQHCACPMESQTSYTQDSSIVRDHYFEEQRLLRLLHIGQFLLLQS
jgi:hypothetical protein